MVSASSLTVWRAPLLRPPLAQKVAAKIQSITGGTHVDVIMVSHLHTDHIGYATVYALLIYNVFFYQNQFNFSSGGIWYLLEKAGITCDKIVDRRLCYLDQYFYVITQC